MLSFGHGGTLGEDVPVLHQLAVLTAHRGLCLRRPELLGVPSTNHRKDGQLHDGIGLHEVRDAPNSPTHGDMASPTELCEGG